MERDEKNAAYLQKLERGIAQIRAGQGIVKTQEELEAMEREEDGDMYGPFDSDAKMMGALNS